jgi:hypothetical protein
LPPIRIQAVHSGLTIRTRLVRLFCPRRRRSGTVTRLRRRASRRVFLTVVRHVPALAAIASMCRPQVRPDTCRPNSLNQANLVTAIAAMLALSTTCADAARRHVGKAPRFAAHPVKVATLPIHVAPEPSYWMYRRCSSAARAADPYTVCFPSNTVRPYLGRDPDINVRFELRRNYPRDSPSSTGN